MRNVHFSTRMLAAALAALACAACAAVPAVALAGAGGTQFSPGASPPAPLLRDPASIGLGNSAIATYFGPGFFGHRTACGQILTRALVGVAHRTLPCGTLVQVSYAGRNLTVPVVDRGPYGRRGAKWDLTAGAARSLGIRETVRIHAQIVGRVPNTPLLGAPEPQPSEFGVSPQPSGSGIAPQPSGSGISSQPSAQSSASGLARVAGGVAG
jgi:rare lipoprotein A (peptidoglycan hydrolase)